MKAEALRHLSRTAKVFLVLLAIEVLGYFSGVSASLGLIHIAFGIVSIVLTIRWLRRYSARLLWRVRNRLLVAYLFIAVVPIVLIATILVLGSYMLLGQITAYLTTAEIERRNELLQTAAFDLGMNLAYAMRADAVDSEFVDDLRRRLPRLEAVIWDGGRTRRMPPVGEFAEIPSWSRRGFKGMVTDGKSYFNAAHVNVRAAGKEFDVFAYEPIDSELLANLLPGVAVVQLVGDTGPRRVRVGVAADGPVSEDIVIDSSTVRALPPSQALFDQEAVMVALIAARSKDTGLGETVVLAVRTRPSLIMRHFLRASGSIGFVLVAVLASIAIIFLFVEAGALLFGVRLTRSITRAVDDLYQGTERVRVHDFSHRIPVRSADQLAELAASFNEMTENVQRLIVEVREKEKLESELEIARDVQAQMFPKRVPHLETLELVGVCNPARVVSGDYYDFIPVDSRRTALAIADISGKGISAALLMAGLRSSLHAQLKLSNGALSVPEIVGRLNQQLFESTSAEKYATLYCGIYDDAESQLICTNAGHLPPLLVHGHEIRPLGVNGVVLGAFPGESYSEDRIEMTRGDLLVAYTDGFTEAENEAQEQFGEQRLAELLLKYRDRPLKEVASLLTDELSNWVPGGDLQDDSTLLLARRL